MQYLMMLWQDEKQWPSMSKEQQQTRMGAYMAFMEAINKADVLKGSNRLRPTSTATKVTVKDGKTTVLDGPYADSKEQLGGYFLIDVPDLDAAIAWAARCPASQHGTIELRPIWPREEMPGHR